MQNIDMQEMSPEFLNCWQAAGNHLNNQVQGGIQSWLRAYPHPPILEHLSFRLGNQLFFVRVEDAEKHVVGPGSLRGLMLIADECKGHACILPMKKRIGGAWQADHGGWGLVDATTGASVDPVMLITDQKIEITEWELQDFAVQVVRDQIKKEGYQLMSWQGNPVIDPAIWFMGKSKKPEWVVVRAVRYPKSEATRPANWGAIATDCAHMSSVGHFASVAVVSAEQDFDTNDAKPLPLWRGYGNFVRYEGLISDL